MGTVYSLIRENIRELEPYSSAGEEFSGEAPVKLDANENPYGRKLNRYPDPYQLKLKEKIAEAKDISAGMIFAGNGSDEVIDLIIRLFCEPGRDNVLSISPTYSMYEVLSAINGVEFRKVMLNGCFDLDVDAMVKAADSSTKAVFLCSPNNPTGNLLSREKILELARGISAPVVVDEAYIDFAKSEGMLPELKSLNNLIIIRTFSKAWGKAGIRLGVAFADSAIVSSLNRIKPPYNVGTPAIEKALKTLNKPRRVAAVVKKIINNRNMLEKKLPFYSFVKKVFPSDANFLLVRVDDAPSLYRHLAGRGVIVRDRSSLPACENCLRISVGTHFENRRLLRALDKYDK